MTNSVLNLSIIDCARVANTAGLRSLRRSCGAVVLSAVLLVFLPASIQAVHAAQHPFLIVKESELAEVGRRATSPQWRPIWNKAASAWNTDFATGNWEDMSRQLNYLMIMLVGDTANADTYTAKIVSVINRWPSQLSRLGGDHENVVDPTSSLFNSILALDLIYNRLSSAQRATAEGHLQQVVDYYRQHPEIPWRLARWGALTTWAVYQQNDQDIATYMAGYNDYLLGASMMSDGSWNQSPGYLGARIAATRLAKSHTIDVLNFNAKFNYYENPQMRQFIEWMGSFAFTPFGGYTRFGDTGHIVNVNIATNNLLFRTSRYGSVAGGIGSWLLNRQQPIEPWTRDHANFLTLAMLPSQSPRPVMPKSLLKEFSGAALWDRTDTSDALSGVLYSLKRETDREDGFGHAHEDVNSIDLTAYGEHILANSGVDYVGRDGQGFDWPGFTPDNGRWHHAYMQNSVLIGDRTSHADTEGGGLVDGVTGGAVEFGRTDSLDALDNGRHRRTLFLVHPRENSNHGYFALLDDVQADAPGDVMKVNLHPNTASGVRVESDQERYRAAIDGFNQVDHDGSEGVVIFYATAPSRVQVKKAWKGDFEFDALHSDYLEAQYPSNDDGKAEAATIVFPVDQSHRAPAMSRINQPDLSGVSINHSAAAVDTLLASHSPGLKRYEQVAFNGDAAFYRHNGSGLTNYAVVSGREFQSTGNARFGFVSANSVSLQMDGKTGNIRTAGGQLTFFYPGITALKYNGRTADVIRRGSGQLTVSLPAGRLALTIDTTPIEQPRMPRVSVADLLIEESAQQADVVVRLSEPGTESITVSLATARQTAVNGEDFYGRSDSLVFAAGETSKRFTIDILDDSVVEATEGFSVRIYAAEGAEVGRSQAMVSIVDDDASGAPSLSLGAARVSEGAERAEVLVTLTPVATNPVRVSIASQPGAAQPGRDYYGIYQQLEFAPGQRSKRINIEILNDSQSEGDEAFSVRLFNANAVIATERVSIGIDDDD